MGYFSNTPRAGNSAADAESPGAPELDAGQLGAETSPIGNQKPMTALEALVKARKEAIEKQTLKHATWLPDVLRIRGSIIPSIFGPVLSVTIFASLVVALTKWWNLPLRLANSVVPLLSVVVGLLLVFRNGSAYERYSEGRKDLTALITASRNLARLAWIQVSLPATPARLDQGKPIMTENELTAEKQKFLKLVCAFAVATKHHLRGESGTAYLDYADILPKEFKHYDTPHEPISSRSNTLGGASGSISSKGAKHDGDPESLIPSSPARRGWRSLNLKVSLGSLRETHGQFLPPTSPTITTPLLQSYTPYQQGGEGGAASLPLPLVIAHSLSRSIYKFKRDGCLEQCGPAGTNALQSLVQTLIDQLGAMERVVRTPLPPVFQIHLKQCVSLYVFALPLVLVDDMSWLMVPVVTLVAFTLMGIEGIAAEVENPFGEDQNDLPMDLEIAELKVEIEYIIKRLPEGMDPEDVFAA